MLWALGFLITFLFGGLTGIILASPPLDFHVSDSYFVVAHFHYVVFGTVVFAMFAGFYFWWPKFTGKMLNERLGKIHFWMLFLGFHGTFLIQHWLGVMGMPRRYADYLVEDNFAWMNQFSSFGSYLLGASMIPFFWNVYITARSREGHRGRSVGLRRLARMGHVLPAAAAQLHVAAADPFGASGPGPAPPGAPRPRTRNHAQPCGGRPGCRRYRRKGRTESKPGRVRWSSPSTPDWPGKLAAPPPGPPAGTSRRRRSASPWSKTPFFGLHQVQASRGSRCTVRLMSLTQSSGMGWPDRVTKPAATRHLGSLPSGGSTAVRCR